MKLTSYFKVLKCLAAMVVLLQSHSVFAESKPYVELDYVRSTISTGGVDFKPFHVKIKGGYYIQDKIAIELQYADSGDDTVNGQTLQLEEMFGYFLRLDSDVQNRVRIYVLAGQVRTTIKTAETREFKDIAYGIGAEEQLQSFRNAYITVEYGKFLSAEGADLTELSLGIRFDF